MLRILILEDHHQCQLLFQAVCKSIFPKAIIKTFSNGDEALIEFSNFKPDIVLLDYNVHGEKTGLDIAKSIRSCDIFTRTICVSDHSDQIKNVPKYYDRYAGKNPMKLKRILLEYRSIM